MKMNWFPRKGNNLEYKLQEDWLREHVQDMIVFLFRQRQGLGGSAVRTSYAADGLKMKKRPTVNQSWLTWLTAGE